MFFCQFKFITIRGSRHYFFFSNPKIYFTPTEIKGQSYIDGRTTVGSVRLDGLSISETELAETDSAILYIDYFGFFKTVEDANAWNPAHVAPVEAPATTEAPVEG